MADKSVKIGLFGSSFNPLHLGHLNLLLSVQEQFRFDSIRVVPARQSPFSKKPLPALDKKLPLLRRALKEHPFLLVDDQEIKRKPPSYTIDTVHHLLKEKPLCKDIFLIMGMDQWLCFDQWKDFKTLMEKTHILVCSRSGFCPFPLPLFFKKHIVSSEANKKALQSLQKGGSLQLLSGRKFYYLPLKDKDISASEVRERCKKGLLISDKVPSSVLQWIQENKLYQAPLASKAKEESLLRFCAKALCDKQAKKIKAFDLRKQPGLAFDFTLVASGLNTRHTKMMASYLQRQVAKEFLLSAHHVEGQERGEWILLDYGDLAVHIFYDYTREYYLLEQLWDGALIPNF